MQGSVRSILGRDKRVQLALAVAIFHVAFVVVGLFVAAVVSLVDGALIVPAVRGWAVPEQRFLRLLSVFFIISLVVALNLVASRRVSYLRQYWFWFFTLSDEIVFNRKRER